MEFWNWGPTTIWHSKESVAFFSSKLLHPSVKQAGEGTAGSVAGKPEWSRKGEGEQAGGVLLNRVE